MLLFLILHVFGELMIGPSVRFRDDLFYLKTPRFCRSKVIDSQS